MLYCVSHIGISHIGIFLGCREGEGGLARSAARCLAAPEPAATDCASRRRSGACGRMVVFESTESVMAVALKVVTVGDKTPTGGVVLDGARTVYCQGKLVALIGGASEFGN